MPTCGSGWFPENQRSLTTRQLVEIMRPQVENMPFSLVNFSVEGAGKSERQITVEVLGPDQRVLISLALELRRRLQAIPVLRDVMIHLRNPVPEIEVAVSHQRAAYLGLNASEIAHGIRAAITGPLANSFRESGPGTGYPHSSAGDRKG